MTKDINLNCPEGDGDDSGDDGGTVPPEGDGTLPPDESDNTPAPEEPTEVPVGGTTLNCWTNVEPDRSNFNSDEEYLESLNEVRNRCDTQDGCQWVTQPVSENETIFRQRMFCRDTRIEDATDPNSAYSPVTAEFMEEYSRSILAGELPDDDDANDVKVK